MKGSKIPADITAAVFDLPRAGFTESRDGLELLVYRTPETRAGISALDGAQDARVFCRIRCTSRDHLRLAPSLRLGVLVKSHNMEPQLFIQGADDAIRASFTLEC
jgi:hypothetical protein